MLSAWLCACYKFHIIVIIIIIITIIYDIYVPVVVSIMKSDFLLMQILEEGSTGLFRG